MYQILKREIMAGHGHSDFYQTEYFFLNKENALEKVKQLSEGYKGFTFKEVNDWDDEGNQILDFVHYTIDECCKVVKIVPLDEEIKLPF